jgi:hypothetical protein
MIFAMLAGAACAQDAGSLGGGMGGKGVSRRKTLNSRKPMRLSKLR